MAEILSIYRHLLRGCTHAVSHQRAAVKNTRRLLRDDFEATLRESPGNEHFLKRAKSTLLLYLAATKFDTLKIDGGILAYRIVGNMASICYHNLSPYTRMQPLNKIRRVGGTDSSALRRRRSTQINNRIMPSALDSFQVSYESSTSSKMGAPSIDAEVLPALQVMPKPIRGPVVPLHARRNALPAWDGQRSEQILQSSPAYIAHLESILEQNLAHIRKLKLQNKSEEEIERARVKIRQEKGPLKSAWKRKAEVDERDALQREASNLLNKVAMGAKQNTGAWIGSSRISKWATGAWLPP